MTSEIIVDETTSFIKIYTSILLNESLQKEAIKYISEDNEYKNDGGLLCRVISGLLNNKHQIQDSIELFNSYLKETSGLTTECIIKLTANIGQLYSLIHKYSDAMYNYLEAIHLVDSKLHLVIY